MYVAAPTLVVDAGAIQVLQGPSDSVTRADSATRNDKKTTNQIIKLQNKTNHESQKFTKINWQSSDFFGRVSVEMKEMYFRRKTGVDINL